MKTKKHTTELVKFMRTVRRYTHPTSYIVLCHDMADVCARYNTKFDRVKFIIACIKE